MLDRVRRLLTGALIIIFTVGVIEIGAFLFYFLRFGESFSYRAIAQERQNTTFKPSELSDDGELLDRKTAYLLNLVARDMVLHPYLGYIPDSTRLILPRDTKELVNDSGFIGTNDPLTPVPPEVVSVLVLGGSVGMGVSLTTEDLLTDRLRTISEYRDRKIVISRMAVGGYKQPQQLLAYAYAMSLGLRYDIVINLDGFNEIALPVTENFPAGINPSFPRSWGALSQSVTDLAYRMALGEVAYLGTQRQELAENFSRAGLRHSIMASTLWRFLDLRLARRAADANIRATQFHVHAVVPAYAAELERVAKDPYPYLAKLWARSSVQLHRLVEANGGHYYHALQPNQYVPGSKPLSAKERRTAYAPDSVWVDPGRRGYPHLRGQSDYLRENGVRFIDLTMMFRDVQETMYFDSCCHFIQAGRERIMEAIADAIEEDLTARI